VDLSLYQRYLDAQRLAKREFSKALSKGLSGYVPSLDVMLSNVEIVSEQDLGTLDIPLQKIKGTYAYSRSTAFAPNFLPLLEKSTEFAGKWAELAEAQVQEGIRDPIQVYEYLNWFYVVEGNKRVSVLKYMKASDVSARVMRLVPVRDDSDPVVRMYYEFMEFNRKTGIQSVWFSKPGAFSQLFNHLQTFDPKDLYYYPTAYKYFEKHVYRVFRDAYLSMGGQEISMTTGDAFLEYARLYGIQEDVDERKLRATLKGLMPELAALTAKEPNQIRTEYEEGVKEGLFSALSTWMAPKKKLRIAFVYAKTIHDSGWTYAHELGRLHLQRTMADQAETVYIENVPENEQAFLYIQCLAEEKYDIVFTTSPTFLDATLKAALEYPATRFFNCSYMDSYKHVTTYFGRIYEPWFLSGLAAGALTVSNVLGYAATVPIPEVISGINAFALGAAMVNPRARIRLEWINPRYDQAYIQSAADQFSKYDADIIAFHNTPVPQTVYKDFGVCALSWDQAKGALAIGDVLVSPVWSWGVLYQKMVRGILNGTSANNKESIHLWWGISSGVVDIFVNKTAVPISIQKNIDAYKQMLISRAYHPFTGPIYDQQNRLRVAAGQTAANREIYNMEVMLLDGRKYISTPYTDAFFCRT